MLVMNSPFRDLDAWFDQVSGRNTSTSTPMPMDAYRREGDVWVHLDLPGIAADTLDITVERNVLTVTGQRHWDRREGDRHYLSERRSGTFSRQVTLGEGLDPEGIEADYTDGVLTLRIPVAERAQPRKIAITSNSGTAAIEATANDA
jgi:HSP20 family protein